MRLYPITIICVLLMGCGDDDIEPVLFEAFIDGSSWQATSISRTYNNFSELSELKATARDGSSITINFEFQNLLRNQQSNFRLAAGSADFEMKKLIGRFNEEINQITIDWETTSETDVSNFQVELSKNGETWEVISTVEAKGGVDKTANYHAFDLNNFVGIKYYRISAIDNQNIIGESSPVIVVFVRYYPALFESSSNFRSPGYNGTITVDFNETMDKVSGSFNFIFKNEIEKEVRITNGIFTDIEI